MVLRMSVIRDVDDVFRRVLHKSIIVINLDESTVAMPRR
jgi:hypothetical protein